MRGLNVLILLAVAYVVWRLAQGSESSEDEGSAGVGVASVVSTILGVLVGLRELV